MLKSLYWKICATFVVVQLVSMAAGITAFNQTWQWIRTRNEPERSERGDRSERGERGSRIDRKARGTAIRRLLAPYGTTRRTALLQRYARARRDLLETIARAAVRDVTAALDRNAPVEQIALALDGLISDQSELVLTYVGADGKAIGPGADIVPGKVAAADAADTLTRLEQHGYATRMQVPSNRGWIYVVQEPVGPEPPDRDDINWQLMQAGGAALVVLLLVAISTGLVAFWAIARKLRELGQNLVAVAEGDLTRRVPNPGSDEIGTLGKSFNQMATRLSETVARLEEVDEKRREFLADVSHELRTPLTSVRANLEALLEPEPPPPAEGPDDDLGPGPHEQAVTHSLEEVEHMTCLVEDLLELARMDSPQYKLVKEEVSLQKVVSDRLERLRTSVTNRGICLKTTFAKEPVRRVLDARRIGQVVTNLMVNAIRSLDQGGKIDIKVFEESDRAVIEICDTGPGIPEQVRARLFEPFVTTRSGGTGLGLAIVRKLVEAHDGQIHLLPREGGGTVARVEL